MFKDVYMEFSRLSEYLQSIALLLARLVVGYGFYDPAMTKWSDINSVANWFSSIGIPLPTFNAYLAASIESVGVVLLIVGFFTRIISIPLIVIMIVAISAVHLTNGFSAGNNGFEIPLYYMIFLIIFLAFGAGRISLDNIFFKEKKYY